MSTRSTYSYIRENFDYIFSMASITEEQSLYFLEYFKEYHNDIHDYIEPLLEKLDTSKGVSSRFVGYLVENGYWGIAEHILSGYLPSNYKKSIELPESNESELSQGQVGLLKKCLRGLLSVISEVLNQNNDAIEGVFLLQEFDGVIVFGNKYIPIVEYTIETGTWYTSDSDYSVVGLEQVSSDEEWGKLTNAILKSVRLVQEHVGVPVKSISFPRGWFSRGSISKGFMEQGSFDIELY